MAGMLPASLLPSRCKSRRVGGARFRQALADHFLCFGDAFGGIGVGDGGDIAVSGPQRFGAEGGIDGEIDQGAEHQKGNDEDRSIDRRQAEAFGVQQSGTELRLRAGFLSCRLVFRQNRPSQLRIALQSARMMYPAPRTV